MDKEEPVGEEEVDGSGDDAEMTVMSKQREQDYQQNYSPGLWESRFLACSRICVQGSHGRLL